MTRQGQDPEPAEGGRAAERLDDFLRQRFDSTDPRDDRAGSGDEAQNRRDTHDPGASEPEPDDLPTERG